MQAKQRKNSFSYQLEAVFAECEQNINSAIHEYQKNIQSAIEELKSNLNSTRHSIH